MARDEASLQPGDVVNIRRAARALHMRDSRAAAWLRSRGLVCSVAGRERVIWGDVLEAIRTNQPPMPKARHTTRASTVANMPRIAL